MDFQETVLQHILYILIIDDVTRAYGCEITNVGGVHRFHSRTIALLDKAHKSLFGVSFDWHSSFRCTYGLEEGVAGLNFMWEW